MVDFNEINAEHILFNDQECEKIILIQGGEEYVIYEKNSQPIVPEEPEEPIEVNLLPPEYFISQLTSVFQAVKQSDGGYKFSCDKVIGGNGVMVFQDIEFDPAASYRITFYGRCTNNSYKYVNLAVINSSGTKVPMNFEKAGENSTYEATLSGIDHLIFNWGSSGTVFYPDQCSIVKVS